MSKTCVHLDSRFDSYSSRKFYNFNKTPYICIYTILTSFHIKSNTQKIQWLASCEVHKYIVSMRLSSSTPKNGWKLRSVNNSVSSSSATATKTTSQLYHTTLRHFTTLQWHERLSYSLGKTIFWGNAIYLATQNCQLGSNFLSKPLCVWMCMFCNNYATASQHVLLQETTSRYLHATCHMAAVAPVAHQTVCLTDSLSICLCPIDWHDELAACMLAARTLLA